MSGAHRGQKGIGSPGTGVKSYCDLSYECKELNPSPLQMQQFPGTESSLQPPYVIFKDKIILVVSI